MRSTPEAAAREQSQSERLTSGAPEAGTVAALLNEVLHILDEAKAEDIVTIDIKGKSTIGDYMVIASGRSDRHVGAIGDQLQKKLKELGYRPRAEGMETCDWLLVDVGDIIVHVFRPEVRDFYKLEKMWTAERPADETAH